MFAWGAQAGDPIGAQKQIGGSAGIASSAVGYKANTWHHAVAVFEAANSRRVYLDGANAGSNTTNLGSISVTETYLFKNTAQAIREAFNGLIADARIYNRALSAAEVYALYDPQTRYDLYAPLGVQGVARVGTGGGGGGGTERSQIIIIG